MIALVVLSFVVVSSYLAWNDQSEMVRTATNEIATLKTQLGDKKPKLIVTYSTAYCIPGNLHFLAVLMSISNAGGSTSVAHQFHIAFSSDKIFPLITPSDSSVQIELGMGPNKYDMYFVGSELLQQRALKGIDPGRLATGWLVFELPGYGIKCSDVNGRPIIFKDVLGTDYQVPLKIVTVPPLPDIKDVEIFIDITFPFKERATLAKIRKQQKKSEMVIQLPH
jgi:hypothetical protein